MNYRYVILTRFNLQYDESSRNLDEAWLCSRIDLLEQYTMPSVQAQENQQFEWFILLDNRTPESARQHLNHLAKNYPRMQLVAVAARGDKQLQEFYTSFAHQLAMGYDGLISTRLDSDDVLLPSFTTEVLKHSNDEHFILSFPCGLQYFTKRELTFLIRYDHNHFLTFFEPVAVVNGALSYDHTKVASILPLVYADADTPMWEEIVHGENILNGYQPSLHARPVHPDRRHYTALIGMHISFRFKQVLRLLKRIAR